MDPDWRFSEWFKQQLELVELLRDENKGADLDFPNQLVETEVDESPGSDDESQVINKGQEEEAVAVGGLESYDDDDDDMGDCCYIEGPNTIENVERHSRDSRASNVWFLTQAYTFVQGVKICIPYAGKPIFGLSKECFESTWVAIHGMQSICMVTSQHLDMTRFPDYLQGDDAKQEDMDLFANVVISEVECILHRDFQHYDADFRLLCTGIEKKPLGVVSFGLGNFKETGYEDLVGCVSKTISFLESTVSSDSLDTDYGTIRAAIRAYQLMCLNELRAEDIWVTIMDVISGDYKNLPIEIIREQLAISKYGRAPSPESEKPLFLYRSQPVTCD